MSVCKWDGNCPYQDVKTRDDRYQKHNPDDLPEKRLQLYFREDLDTVPVRFPECLMLHGNRCQLYEAK